MRQIKDTFVPPCRMPTAFGAPPVRSYVMDGPRVYVIDPITGVRADTDETLDGELDVFMRARLANG